MKRFLHPYYVYFSSILAWKAYVLGKRNRKFPISLVHIEERFDGVKHPFARIEKYHSFSYFDYQRCTHYYQATSGHVTVDIIKAMVYYNEEDRNDSTFVQMVDDILEQYATICDKYCKFNLSFESNRYTFEKKFLSGIVQGKAVSLIVRAYAVTKDAKYITLAKRAIEACKISIDDNGAFRMVNGLPWVEEYPDTSKPSMVLNGHLFLLVGLIDYITFTDDKQYENFTKELIKSTLTFLPYYRFGDDLLYELSRWKFCNVHYLGIMTPLFEHLYKQTNIETFKEYMEITNNRCNWKLFNWLIENQES